MKTENKSKKRKISRLRRSRNRLGYYGVIDVVIMLASAYFVFPFIFLTSIAVGVGMLINAGLKTLRIRQLEKI